MAPKKTLSNWLTNRYLIIIRNEENFAEKKTIKSNIARGVLILAIAFLITLGISIYIVTVVLEQWLDPRYAMSQSNKELVDLTMRIDSLESEVILKDQYLNNIRLIVGGDVKAMQEMSANFADGTLITQGVDLQEHLPPIDSQFRAEYENDDILLVSYAENRSTEFREFLLFTPVEGLVTDGFNPKTDHFGVDIVAKENEPVKSTADGVVIISSWTLDTGYVIGIQHRGNLISMYKHNSELFKNVGNFVSAGEIIAVIGNTGELTSGPHLHFELWQNGNPVNPQEFIAF
ncbi:MAG: murein DD-endopeptidase MepM/ murein hydrolase activator NlpD [Marinoscillum sp.]